MTPPMRSVVKKHAPSLVALACVALLIAPLAWLGARRVYRAHLVQTEQFTPAVPLEGPYTEEELRSAQGQLANVVPADEFVEGLSPEQLESAAEATRRIERARKEAWEDRRPERLRVAIERRRIGLVLLSLAALLLGAWGYAAWKVKLAPPARSRA
jgi:hypothetical protein